MPQIATNKKPSEKSLSRAPAWILAALIMLIVWETGATLYQHYSAPQEQHWKAAAEKIRSERKSEEPILFAPGWVNPLGRYYLGDMLPLEMLLLSDVDRYSRIWEVSIRGARHPWLKEYPPMQSWIFGQVTVKLFEKKPARILFDFTHNITQAQVQKIGDQIVHCPLQNNRFACEPDKSWNWVGSYLAEVGHRPYRCIYAHPVDGQVMVIQFSHVPLGKNIVGYTGIDDFENRKAAQGPVQLTIKIDNQLLGTIYHQNQWPWHQFSFNTATYAGNSHKVRFEIAADNSNARSFCFSVEAREQ